MTTSRPVSLLLGLLSLLLLAGCATDRFQVEPSFGEAVQGTLAQQIIYPQGTPAAGWQGLDGASAKAVMDRYVAASVSPPAQTSSFSVGLGAAGSSPMTVPAALGTTP